MHLEFTPQNYMVLNMFISQWLLLVLFDLGGKIRKETLLGNMHTLDSEA